MDTTTLDFNTLALLVAILGSTMGSTLTLVTLIVRQSNRQEDSGLDPPRPSESSPDDPDHRAAG